MNTTIASEISTVAEQACDSKLPSKAKKPKTFTSANMEEKVEDLEAYKKRAAIQEMEEIPQRIERQEAQLVPPNTPQEEDTDEYWDHFSSMFFQLFPEIEVRPRSEGFCKSVDELKELEWRQSRQLLQKHPKMHKERCIDEWSGFCHEDEIVFENKQNLAGTNLNANTMEDNLNAQQKLILPVKPRNPFIGDQIQRHKPPNVFERSIEELRRIQCQKIKTYGKEHLPFTNDNTTPHYYSSRES